MTNSYLYNKSNFFTKIVFIYLIFLSKSFAIENNKLEIITEGNENAKIEILI